MSKLLSELVVITRYLSGGVLNTLVGFSIIFLLMAIGISPLLANVSGYVTGFIVGFFLSKKFVFRSNGHVVGESLRYLFAFVFCFLLNLVVLQLAIIQHFDALIAQLLAMLTYTISMYGLTRYFVFRG